MNTRYILIRDVTMDECPWLSEDHFIGEIIYMFYGATYWCIGDGAAVCHNPEGPFFEVPNDSFDILL